MSKIRLSLASTRSRSLKIAEALFAQLRTGNSAELDVNDLFDFAIALLRVNYRIDASLLSHLQILAPDICVMITRHALDWPTLESNLKKTLSRLGPIGTNTESGATPPTAD